MKCGIRRKSPETAGELVTDWTAARRAGKRETGDKGLVKIYIFMYNQKLETFGRE